MLRLTLPWPPSINHYYRKVGPRVLISKPGRLYRNAVITLVHQQRLLSLSSRLDLTIEAAPPDHRQRDLDNLTKGLLDALQHAGVFVNDSQIDHLHRRDPMPGGQVAVTITESQA